MNFTGFTGQIVPRRNHQSSLKSDFRLYDNPSLPRVCPVSDLFDSTRRVSSQPGCAAGERGLLW
jgi:hypothetical protein